MAQLLLLLEIIREEASSNRSSSDENDTSLSGYSVIDSDSVSLSTNNNSLPNKTIPSTARNKDDNNKKKKDWLGRARSGAQPLSNTHVLVPYVVFIYSL